ncbi:MULTISPECIES: hypothetical protein [unclassified Solwaraspora]|uniref:hypothetical protein n=1 Tax=unclassified Solwaraspora TaxID=2627926 RepID=UPI00248D1689|nr:MULTISPECIES: hypothetical protein [unclassified Solwaraspora]WBB97903.1 hypothetical protein O7553_02750 [Solwaraspora sp. WMMA2059]WBC23538.1 hypothetical protein O7543_14600 [Solwaraspora sp. WMMA2080]WJK34377.1 hypothetical protein O7610_27855 [Solwaraspora sp. WMMA2065]
MVNRRRIAKPSVALWMLVALADAALLVASVGLVPVLLVLSGGTAVTLAAVAAYRMTVSERAGGEPTVVPAGGRWSGGRGER